MFDGFNAFADSGDPRDNEDDVIANTEFIEEVHFTPVDVMIPNWLANVGSQVFLDFHYNHQDPSQVTIDSVTGLPVVPDLKVPSSGLIDPDPSLRLWTKQSWQTRNKEQIDNGGDFINPGVVPGIAPLFEDTDIEYTWAELAAAVIPTPFDNWLGGWQKVTLYLEGIKAFGGSVGATITYRPNNEDEGTDSDSALVTVIDEVTLSATDVYAEEPTDGSPPDDMAFTISRGEQNVHGNRSVYFEPAHRRRTLRRRDGSAMVFKKAFSTLLPQARNPCTVIPPVQLFEGEEVDYEFAERIWPRIQFVEADLGRQRHDTRWSIKQGAPHQARQRRVGGMGRSGPPAAHLAT